MPALEAVRTELTGVVAKFLGMSPVKLDSARPLVLYGLDSISSVELLALLETEFKQDLPDWLILEHPTIDGLARILSGEAPADSRAPAIDLMLADSTLPDDVRPAGGRPAGVPANVLLTGATGFLGAFVLRGLIAETGAVVHCLVRSAASERDGLARIERNLAQYGLWDASMTDRVRVVLGDLVKPQLGLSAGDYRSLSAVADAVYHTAADVNWALPYAALRDANVLATLELIRLACAEQPKTFHFVSSLSVCYAVDGPPVVSETDDMLPHLGRLPLGYAQSKCVAETLVRAAGARGLPVHIHRPSLILGESSTGASNLDDVVAALLKGCIQMGAAPDLDWTLDGPPVDHVVRAILRLGRADDAGTRVFNITNPRPRHWRECVLWANLIGYAAPLVPYAQWKAQLERDAAAPEHALHRLRSFFLRETPGGATIAELYQDAYRSAVDTTRTSEASAAAGIECPKLDAELLDRYFDNFIARGFLAAPARRRPTAVSAAVALETRVAGLLRRHFADDSLRVSSLDRRSTGSDGSIIGELTAWQQRRRTGLFQYRATLDRAAERSTLDLMLKVKPADDVVLDVGETLADMCAPALGAAVRDARELIGVRGGHIRELAIYEHAQTSARVKPHVPGCFGTWRDDTAGEWGIVLEYLDDMALMDASGDASVWSRAHIEAALTGLAHLHAEWYGRERDLEAKPWMGSVRMRQDAVDLTPLWRALADHAAPYFTEWVSPAIVSRQRALIDTIDDWWAPLDASPRTLIHNDFNPRNVALRHDGSGFRLCAYDWEMATVGAPARDLAEFLCFVLPPGVEAAVTSYYVDFSRTALERATGRAVDATAWHASFESALAAFLIDRLSFYALINRVRQQRFLPRVMRTWWTLQGRGV